MKPAITVVIVTVAAVLLYAAAAWNHGFVYDDNANIIQAPAIHTLADAALLFVTPAPSALPYYRPIVRITLQVQKAIHGLQPRPFIIFNSVLAGAVLLAAYGLLRRPVFAIGHWPALLGAAVFVCHPVASTCVYPIASGRETLLPALFFLISIGAYLGRGWKAYTLCLIGFALALCGKETAILLPILFVLADGLGLTGWKRSAGALIARYAPIVVLLGIYLFVRQRLYHGVEMDVVLAQRPMGPIWSLLYSIQAIAAPRVALEFEPPLSTWLSWPRLAAAMAGTCALVLSGWQLRGGARKPLFFWLVWFVATQALTANILRQDAAFSERYVFLALLAPVAVAASLYSGWRPANAKRLGVVMAVAASLLLVVVTTARARYFANEGVFYTQWVRTNPGSAEARVGMGKWFADHTQFEAALEQYDRAIAIRPDFANALNNRGRALEALGRTVEAKAEFERAIVAEPGHVEALNNLATMLGASGDYTNAIAYCRRALASDPASAVTYQNLASLEMLMGNLTDAIVHFERALTIQPDLMEAHFNLANALESTGQREQARAHLRQALTLAKARQSEAQSRVIAARLEQLERRAR